MKTMQTMRDWIQTAEDEKTTLARVMERQESRLTETPIAQIRERMESQLQVMEASVERGVAGVRSRSGLSGGDARRLDAYRQEGKTLAGSPVIDAMTCALAVNEVNAAMGVICATPTAGSSGVVPGVLLALRERLSLTRDEQIDFLITAGGAGLMIANHASISGAGGGCQAEIGSAAAMAACALTEASGGSPDQAGQALALTLKALLGLTCDPVAGLVEVPCIKRNAAAAALVVAMTDMALAGVKSAIPADEVILAMGSIGRMMPMALRETALGGLAQTVTARRYDEELRKEGKIQPLIQGD